MRFIALATAFALALCASAAPAAAPAADAEALLPFLNPDYCTNRGGECESDGKKGTCSCSMSATSPTCLCIT
ncbi:hypothetical protein B0J12DRAFT_740742 [Macrophomina phaseolina]|uniref:Uncharacterized protein n=1 Tax=Macrophomina phaseolina TaxID=35725 RepID=A0ABQ8GAD7_9PEZI|nr:hypothetical protein B0J12DRAFT_740742 [Macrophomina phaseolina]